MKQFLSRNWLLGPLLAGMTIVGCNREQNQMLPPRTPEVLVGCPVAGKVTDYEDFTGRTDAIHSVEVKARTTGYLLKINFKDGADVKKNQVLFEIDPTTYEAERDRAQAAVSQAEARLKRLESDYSRARNAFTRGAISPEEMSKIAGDRDEAEASLRVAKQGLRIADINLGYCKVFSSIDGRITRRLVDPGNMIKADETTLTTIHKLDPMYAYFDVDERTVLRLRELARLGKIKPMRDGTMKVLLGTSREEGFPHEGTIDFASAFIDSGTGTQLVRAVFDNKDVSLVPGLFVRIRMPIGNPYHAVLVPEPAIGTDQGRKFVYVLEEKAIEKPGGSKEVVQNALYRQVSLGPINKGMRVILEGVTTRDRVIISGLQRVRPGAPVVPLVRGRLQVGPGMKHQIAASAEAGAAWELDIADPKVQQQARDLNGKLVIVRGETGNRPDADGRPHPVVRVHELKAAE